MIEKLTKTTFVINDEKININDIIIAKNVKTGEILKGMVTFISYQFFEISQYKSEKTIIGLEGKDEPIEFQVHNLSHWEFKKVNDEGELILLNDLAKESEIFNLDVSDYLILINNKNEKKYCGMISYATEDTILFSFVVGYMYDSHLEQVEIQLNKAHEWSMQRLLKGPFENQHISLN